MKRPDPAGRLKRRLAMVAVMALPVLLAGCFGKTSAESLTCPSGAATPGLDVAQFTYFVAVVDAASHILNEQRVGLAAHFVGSENFLATTENITVHLPVKRVAEGGNYGVVAGFQLTADQIQFNNAQQQPPAQ